MDTVSAEVQRELNGETLLRGRRPKYDERLQREIARRYDVYRANLPRVLTAEFGISEKTIMVYWRKWRAEL